MWADIQVQNVGNNWDKYFVLVKTQIEKHFAQKGF